MFIKKIEIDTKKLYYSFQWFGSVHKDDKFKYNVTTISSTYSLGNTINTRISSDGHATRANKKNIRVL